MKGYQRVSVVARGSARSLSALEKAPQLRIPLGTGGLQDIDELERFTGNIYRDLFLTLR